MLAAASYYVAFTDVAGMWGLAEEAVRAVGEIQDLGEWAESRFATLCAAVGVVRNKAVQDRTGWDYLVEFPSTVVAMLPPDLHPIGPSARVQVKSKRSGKAAIRLKLSNAVRFAKSPDPCFIVLFLATAGGEPVRIFAKHVWEDFIADALERARIAGSDGDAALHRLHMPVSFGSGDEHTADLLSWMRKTIDEMGGSYGEKKRFIVQTVGMEDGGIYGTITFKADSWSELVDHELGLIPHAPVSHVTIKQQRFGINAASPLVSMEPHTTTISSEPHPCRVRIRGTSGAEIWMDGGLRVPHIPSLPEEYLRWRVVTDFIDIVSGPGVPNKLNLTFSGTDQRTLRQLRCLVDVLQMALAGPLDIQVRIDGQALFWGTSETAAHRWGPWLSRFIPMLELLEMIAGSDVPKELTLSIADIEAARKDIVRLNGLVRGEGMSMTVTMDRTLDGPLGAKTHIAYDFANVGAWAFMALVSRRATCASQDEATFNLACDDPRLVESFVRPGDGASHQDALMKLYQTYMTGDGVITLFDGDFRLMMEQKGEHASQHR